MKAVQTLPRNDEDAARENRITEHLLDLSNALTSEERRRHFKLMEEEIKARSPRQVERMERQQGLR